MEHQGMLREIADQTVNDLAIALKLYYPVFGNNDIPETLTATYLAFRLRLRGYTIYPQVQLSGKVSNHLDYVAIDATTGCLILIEGKRMYNSGQAQSLGKDWRRLQACNIEDERRRLPLISRKFACLVATTWDLSFSEWWKDRRGKDAPGRLGATYWSDLKAALDSTTLIEVMEVDHAQDDWKHEQLFALFALIELPCPCSETA